ncbi:MAG TPA: fused MFS/spermidine synthase, partial [Nitrospira sp.]|nr:fused MFS/spermidine synthase [Nitrospira sp.]
MSVLWSTAIFLSAFLLFLIQPMMAKMILPMLGGTPAVWNTCMLFYQATLLCGYGYVHLLTSRIEPRRQMPVHLGLMMLPLLMLPVGLPAGWVPPDQPNPAWWVLLLLSMVIGPPFFLLSTTAPLLQKWFSWTDHPSARDPYFLYAASNAGSMLALFGYPLFIEPWLPLKGTQWLTQTNVWSVGYGVLVFFIAACAGWVMRMERLAGAAVRPGAPEKLAEPVPTATMLRWILLAFVPSSFLLGATTHITLNVAAIPLLWVIPLAIYLLTFILVFAHWPAAFHRAMIVTLPVVLVLLALDVMPSVPELPVWMQLFLPLVGLGVIALVCHGELAASRPSAEHLTMFYLLMSVGGALGGLFNALVAPVMFRDTYEYQLMLILAALLIPKLGEQDRLRTARWSPYRVSQLMQPTRALFFYVVLASLSFLLVWSLRVLRDDTLVVVLLCTGASLSLWYGTVGSARRFGAGLAFVLIAAFATKAWFGDRVLYQTRTFFGVLKVVHDKEDNTHVLIHGVTKHGIQRVEPEARRESVSYFHPTGPYGQVFTAFSGTAAKQRIAVTGLGIAALANYLDRGQSLTYYEIDPAVVDIAQDTQLFTYYQDTKRRGADLRVVVGDARLKMESAPDHSYDMIILDAFTSDAIPVHLLTREAMQLYFRKLAPDGLLVAHISNGYLTLEPVLANIA